MDLDGSYCLGSNLDMTGFPFQALGTISTPFIGTLDGNSKTISGLRVDASGSDYQGLFAVVGSTGLVKDLTVDSPEIVGGSTVGALVGWNEGRITNVRIQNGTVNGNNDVGGLLGRSQGLAALVENSFSSAAVTGKNRVGGLIGYSTTNATSSISNQTSIDKSHTSATVTGTSDTGGLIGKLESDGVAIVSVSNSHASGTVTGRGDNVGGLVGYAMTTSSAKITIGDSYAQSSVTIASGSTGNNVGGLVGHIGPSPSAGFVTIERCYAEGDVSGSAYIGGLVGQNYGRQSGIIQSSYATGNVTASGEKAGGLVGWNSGAANPIVQDSYAHGAVEGSDYVGGLLGTNAWSNGIKNSYATGSITSSGTRKGALLGSQSGTLQNSYFDEESSGLNSAVGEGIQNGATGYSSASGSVQNTTPAQVTQQDFTSWDFSTPVWQMLEGQWPTLAWQD